MESNFKNAMASTPQFWNWLENRRSEDDEMSRKAVEAKAEKTRMVKIKRRK